MDNKYELMSKVNVSNLSKEAKLLLNELIIRWNKETGQCNPGVERLCKVIGMKNEKNFKGVEHYLPGLVTSKKVGRKNFYTLNLEAIAALDEASVSIKHTNTPAVEGVYTPSVEGVLSPDTPAVADNTPAVEGANSKDNTKVIESKVESTTAPVVASAPTRTVASLSSSKEGLGCSIIPLNEGMGASPLPFEVRETAKGQTYYLFDNGVTGPVFPLTQTGSRDSDPRLSLIDRISAEIDAQIAALAPGSNWDKSRQDEIASMAKDFNGFEPKVRSAGRRISLARRATEYVDSTW